MTTTLVEEPATMFTLLALLVLAVVLDTVWKLVRSRRETTHSNDGHAR